MKIKFFVLGFVLLGTFFVFKACYGIGNGLPKNSSLGGMEVCIYKEYHNVRNVPIQLGDTEKRQIESWIESFAQLTNLDIISHAPGDIIVHCNDFHVNFQGAITILSVEESKGHSNQYSRATTEEDRKIEKLFKGKANL